MVLKKINILLLPLLWILAVHISTAQKRSLTPEDYSLWNDLSVGGISNDGNWVFYTLQNKRWGDSLFIHHTKTHKKIALRSDGKGKFSENSLWFAYLSGDTVSLQSLTDGSVREFTKAKDFRFIGSHLYVLSGNEGQDATFVMHDLNKGQVHTIKGVYEYRFDPTAMKAAVCREQDGKYWVEIISPDNYTYTSIILESCNRLSGLTWNKKGNVLAFFEGSNTGEEKFLANAAHSYNVRDRRLKTLASRSSMMPPGNTIAKQKLVVHEDWIYFKQNATEREMTVGNAPNVEVWHTSDNILPPGKRKTSSIGTLWLPGPAKLIYDEALTELIPVGNEHALLFSKEGYTPDFKFGGEDLEDIYITDLLSGKRKLLIKGYLNDRKQLLVAPKGKYIMYFKDKHWWIYNVNKDRHINATLNIAHPVENTSYDSSGAKPAYGCAGWTNNNDGEMLIYDQYDIWRIAPNGVKPVRLTKGREQGISYRLYEDGGAEEPQEDFFNHEADLVDLSKMQIFEIKDDYHLRTGYAAYQNTGRIDVIAFEEKNLSRLHKAKNCNAYAWIAQNFDHAPHLMYSKQGRKTVIRDSNPHQKEFHWGKSEIIRYTDEEGNALRASLFYPANYDPKIKYPMVVCVYEKKAKEVRNYISPSLYMHSGFNVTNYTAEGYFVLYPDINYSLNEPAWSALRCVNAAVKKVKGLGLVIADKIGIYGHSMGGMETTFIIGNTDVFAAAVAGAPVTNLISNYLDIDGLNQPNIWRYESQQLRLILPYYDPKFGSNSPLMHAEKITAPLLLWAGKNDQMVNWMQSREFFMALWKLGKKGTLLLYPDEDHVMGSPETKKDVYLKTKAWFDHYLKGADTIRY